jgi:Fe-S cluster assembly protein SufD
MPELSEVVTTTSQLSLATVEQLSATKHEPDWLLQFRRNAWQGFEHSAIPDWTRGIRGWWSGVVEESIFDNLKSFVPAPTHALEALPAEVKVLLATKLSDTDDEETEAGNSDGVLIQYNSEVISATLTEQAKAQGVILCSLDEAVQKHPALVQKYFMTRAVKPDESKFTALHAALWNGGVFLYVPRGVKVAQPIRAIFYMDAPNLANFTHTLVVTEGDAEVRLVEEHISPNGEAHSIDCGITEIFCGNNARTEYYDQQEWGTDVNNFSVKRAMVERYGLHKWVVATLGSATTRLTLEAVLEGENSRAETNGFTFSNGTQHFDIRTTTKHTVRHTTADALFKTVLNGSSQVGFEGIIRADKPAQDTESFLLANTLYLNESCKADVQPGLDVWANEVRCMHGATIGMIDEEQVFYLQSRGIPVEEARELIVEGFLEGVIGRVPLEGVRQRLRQSVKRKLA